MIQAYTPQHRKSIIHTKENGMKKILLLLLLTAVVGVFCACGDGADVTTETPDTTLNATDSGDYTPTQTKPVETEPLTQNSGYTVEFEDGKTFAVGAVIADVEAIYGEWMYYAEAPSCIHPGMDKIYTFDGFDITTSPDADGHDCVYEIAITSDAVAVVGGLTIGASRDTMESVLGTEYTEQFGVVRYVFDEVSVSVILDGDFITSLVITANW